MGGAFRFRYHLISIGENALTIKSRHLVFYVNFSGSPCRNMMSII